MEKDSGDAPHFLHVKEFVVEFIENTLESGMTAFDPKQPLDRIYACDTQLEWIAAIQ